VPVFLQSIVWMSYKFCNIVLYFVLYFILYYYFTWLCQLSSQFVESMLEIHVKYSELVQSVFNSDQLFYGALDKVASYYSVIMHAVHTVSVA